MSSLVSVVVPIYNVEKYLKRCVDSILAQTYSNIEIILVNDGSPDACPSICDMYSQDDSRIKVIHKKNGGLSDARNVGIEIATGRFITFIDSDDFIHPFYIEGLLAPFKKKECDISFCQYKKVDDSFQIADEIIDKNIKYNYVSSKRALYPDVYKTVAWAKLYKIELFNEIRYPVGKIHEDEATTYKLFYESNEISVINLELYFYYMSPDSIVRSEYKRKNLDIIPIMEEKLAFLNKNKEIMLYNIESKRYCSMLLRHYYFCKKYLPNSNDIQQDLLDKFKANYKKVLNVKEVKLSSRLLMLICRFIPSLYGVIAVNDIYKK